MFKNPFSNSYLFIPDEDAIDPCQALFFCAYPNSPYGITLSRSFSRKYIDNTIKHFKQIKDRLQNYGLLNFERFHQEYDSLSTLLIDVVLNPLTAANDVSPGIHNCDQDDNLPTGFTFFLKRLRSGGYDTNIYQGVYYPDNTLSISSITPSSKVSVYRAVSRI
ncbi:hypothetical protein [Microcystis aeruginosa]|uniref:hypothetical protein n=1 Tax=Microcystis aeruginosa TaxID=1126 RepID=UPI000B0325E6|nr:hypothetical protein [Microcystis aeruginosa]BCU13572.1 hypothetical protein MAN88_41360 [Microcystis aeruginosa]